MLAVAFTYGRRLASCALLLAACLALTGCTLFNKRPGGDRAPNANGGGGVPPAKFPTNNDPLTGGTGASAAQPNPNLSSANSNVAGGALLAGRVIDGFSRPPSNTSIRWASLDEKSGAEQEVSVTPEGYFTIQGLKPGSQYKLMARGKAGERLVAGISYTTAPNIRVLIQVKEEFAGGATPAVPPAPGATSPGATSMNAQPPGWNGNSAFPGSAEHALPTSITVPGGPTSSAPANNWTAAPGVASQGTTWPPLLELPRTKIAPPPLQIPHVAPALPAVPEHKPGGAFPTGVANLIDQPRIPSCVRVGDRIVNFALNEVNGQAWDLRQRKGKLVLVDCWATYCPPCLETLPVLRDLQAKYGGSGLEIVGVAYEQGGTTQDQAYRVMATCRKLGVNYRQLLGTGADCPVRRELRVRLLPTMVLLDEQGFIVWRGEGGAPDVHQELDRVLQRRLNNRVY